MDDERGYYRRVLIQTASTVAQADMEDDFHRFGVDLEHDGERITGASGSPIRIPWTTCKFAASALNALVGKPLHPSPAEFGLQLDAHFQCTHMYDLACLAAASAARGVDRRLYDAFVSDPRDGVVNAHLDIDGKRRFTWKIVRKGGLPGPRGKEQTPGVADKIQSPPFAGRDLKSLLADLKGTVDAEMFQDIYVFRRAIQISRGRVINLDTPKYTTPAPLMGHKKGDCFTFQPEIALGSKRVFGSVRDFAGRRDELLADMERQR